VTGEPNRVSAGQMLAYVDDCLSRSDRAALEARMIEYPEIRNRVESWLWQNEAIRAAFPDPGAKPAAAAGRTPPGAEPARDASPAAREGARAAGPAEARIGGAEAKLSERWRLRRGALALVRQALLTLAAAAVLWGVGGGFLAGDRSAPLARGATMAYRAFADNSVRPVEIAASDRDALSRWFAPQIPHAAPAPELSAAGLNLLGARVVPGAMLPAQFLLYENARHERFALAVEASDSPPESDLATGESGGLAWASWTGVGHSFALVGRASSARLAELARLIRERRPKN
jgi:anti-sigma factor RsiW